MANLSIDVSQSLQYSCRRQVVNLFKEFLSIIENLSDEHDEALAKLATAIPSEYHPYINLADYLTEDKSERLRREILQRGNDCARAIENEINQYDIEFKRHE